MLKTIIIQLAFFMLSIANISYGQALTSIDSISIWPKRLFIPLFDSSTLIHEVRSQAIIDTYSGKSIMAMDVFNCLFPVTKSSLRSLPGAAKYLFIGDTLLVSMAVLSDKDGTIAWQPVKPDTIPTYQLRPLDKQFAEAARRLEAYRQAGNPQSHLITTRINTFPIISRNGHYWTPNAPVLTQYFLIRTKKTTKLDKSDYVTINIDGPVLDFNAPWRTIQAMYTSSTAYSWSRVLPIGIVKAGMQQGAYKFWSRIGYTIADPTIRHYGAGTFLYKPGIGLLFGNYLPHYPIVDEHSLPTLNKLVIDDKTP